MMRAFILSLLLLVGVAAGRDIVRRDLLQLQEASFPSPAPLIRTEVEYYIQTAAVNRCSLSDPPLGEFLGFQNKTCFPGSKRQGSAGRAPMSGPILRSNTPAWLGWTITVAGQSALGNPLVILKTFYYSKYATDIPRCVGNIVVQNATSCTTIDGPDAPFVHLQPRQLELWELIPVVGAANTYTIAAASRGAECLRFLGAPATCTEPYVQLYPGDDGSGKQRWIVTPVVDDSIIPEASIGPSAEQAPPPPPPSSPPPVAPAVLVPPTGVTVKPYNDGTSNIAVFWNPAKQDPRVTVLSYSVTCTTMGGGAIIGPANFPGALTASANPFTGILWDVAHTCTVQAITTGGASEPSYPSGVFTIGDVSYLSTSPGSFVSPSPSGNLRSPPPPQNKIPPGQSGPPTPPTPPGSLKSPPPPGQITTPSPPPASTVLSPPPPPGKLGGKIWVTNSGTNDVTVCDIGFDGRTLVNCVRQGVDSVLSGPTGMAVQGGYAFLPNLNDNSISSCPWSSGTLGECIPGDTLSGGNPYGIKILGNTAYVPSFSSNFVLECPILADGVVGTCIDGGSDFNGPSFITLSANGLYAYVPNYNAGTVTVCSITGESLTACAMRGLDVPGANGAAISPDGTTLFVSMSGGIASCPITGGGATLGTCTQGVATGFEFSGEVFDLQIKNNVVWIATYASNEVVSCDVSGATLINCAVASDLVVFDIPTGIYIE